MDTIMLDFKSLLFLALELTVVVIVGAVILAGVYQIVRDRVRESRLQDQVTPERDTTGATLPHRS